MKKYKIIIIVVICILLLSSNNTALIDRSIPFSGLRTANDMSSIEDTNIEKITVSIQRSFEISSCVYYITPDRILVSMEFEREHNYFHDSERNPITTAEKALSEEEYTKLIDSIYDNDFMTLPKEMNNYDIYDGENIYMEVQMNGFSHIVGGYMPQESNEKFKNIYEQFIKLINWDSQNPGPASGDEIILIEPGGINNGDNMDIKITNIEINGDNNQ